MGHLRETTRFVRRAAILSVSVLVSFLAEAQSQPAVGSVKPSAAPSAVAGQPEFFDEPKFTVAGVSEFTNPGGHGSDTVLRTAEELTKKTAELKKEESTGPSPQGADVQSPLLHQNESELHHRRGEIEEKAGHPLEAVREYQRAAELEPSEPNLFDWGTELLTHRAPEPAIEVFTQGNRLFPRSPRLLLGLSVAEYARGSYDDAFRRLFEASDLNPDDANPYLFLGKMQNVETSQADGIVERLARFAKLQPDNALANFYYAVALSKQRPGSNDRELSAQVESLLAKAVRMDPKLGTGYLQLGILYEQRKDLPKAIAAYQKSAEVSPKLAEAHYRLAQIYKQTGNQAEAKKEFGIYNQVIRETAEEVKSERHEIQQFVYTLRDASSTPSSR